MSRTPTSTDTDRVSLLADPTRRAICSILTDPDPPISERDLAGELAAHSLDKPANQITDGERQQQLIRLHHHQLPKLADHGLVVYDRSTRTVSITPEGSAALTAVTHPPQQSAVISTTSN